MGSRQDLDLDLLLSVSSDLGAWFETENGERRYQKSDDCLGCLKDLQRFLRNDDPDIRTVFFKLSKFETAKTDLVPLIKTYPGDRELVFNALKVLTFLTMPVDMSTSAPEQQQHYQRSIKALFTQPEPVTVIVSLVAEPLSKLPRMKQEDVATVQLVLTFFRNLLDIPDETSQGSGRTTRSLQAPFLTTLFNENVMELLLLVTQHSAQRPFKDELPLLLGLLRAVFTGVSAQELAAARAPARSQGPQRQQQQQQQQAQQAPAPARQPQGQTSALLQDTLRQRQRSLASALAAGPRINSRGRGTFMRTHGDHEKAVFLSNRCDKQELAVAAPPARTALTKDPGVVQLVDRLPVEVLWRLRGWTEELLRGGYNILMRTARRELEPGLGISKLEALEFVNFLKLTCLFTGFVRHMQASIASNKAKGAGAGGSKAPAAGGGSAEGAGAAAGPEATVSAFATISSTMGWETFHLVHVLWLTQVDMPTKSDAKNWDLQFCSMSLLKEMLLVLDLAERQGSPADRKAADSLQRRLLHDDMKDSGLLPVLSRIMRAFNPKKEPRSHAADMLQAMHVVLQMYDRLQAAEAGGFLVRKRAPRGGAGRRKKQQQADDGMVEQDGAGEAEGGDETETAAAVPEGEGCGETSEAAKARESGAGGAKAPGVGRERDPLAELYSESDMSDEGEGSRRHKEVALDLNRRLRQELATPAIVHFVVEHGLRHYASNSAPTNAAVHAVLTRISAPEDAGGLGLMPMLYQLSVLRVMHALLADRSIRTKERLPAFQDLLKLATKVVRELFAKLAPAPQLPPGGAAAGAGSGSSAGAGAGGAGAEPAIPVEPAAEADEEGQGTTDQVEEARKKEAEIQRQLSGMLFLDIMFWKSAAVAEDINRDYLVRFAAEHGLDGMPSRQRKRADLGDNEGEVAAKEPGEAGAGGAGEGLGHKKKLLDPLAERKEMLRQLLQKQNRVSGGGGGGGGSGLGAAERERLLQLFEAHNCRRVNLDMVVAGMPGMTERQVSKELKALGLKWGRLTDGQLAKLRELWSRHQLDPDYRVLIAAGLTGGWTSKQVGSLLKRHGLMGSSDGEEGDDEEEGGWEGMDAEGGEGAQGAEGAPEEEDEGLKGVEDGELRELWEKLSGRPDTLEKMCEELAISNDLPAPPAPRALQRRLQALGLVRGPKQQRPKQPKAPKAKVDVVLLKELAAEFKDHEDALNQIAARLPGSFSVVQVQKLLHKHALVGAADGEKKLSRKEREADERRLLAEAFTRYHADPDCMQLIADSLPGVVTAKKVRHMLRKHGLLESMKRPRAANAGGRGKQHEDEDVGGVGGHVPEPDAGQVLELLAAIQQAFVASGGRWMDARGAVAWVLGKVEAAEQLWSQAPSPADYALTMSSEVDQDFFMTENAQE